MKKHTDSFPIGFVPFHQLSEMTPDTPFLVALSGGADSRMLFELAARYCRLYGGRFYACHVNHGIRGDDAIRDRDFCIGLAESCPQCAHIFVLNADVPSLAQNSGLSIEHQARNTRYDFFQKIMKENSIPILATAHNSDDNLETLIFNLTRGSGAKGMRGIPRSRRLDCGILVRPMLGISKSEALGFCRENSLDFVTDITNSDTDYTRNLIRAKVIPILEQINPAVRESASRLSSSMNELLSFTLPEIDKFLPGDGSLSLTELANADPRILPYLLSAAADRCGIDLEAVHIDALSKLCIDPKDGASVSLPGSFRAAIYGDRLCFESDTRENAAPTAFDIPLSEGETLLPCGKINVSKTSSGILFDISLPLNSKKSVNSKNVYKLDIRTHIIFDTMFKHTLMDLEGLRIRSRLPGDRILSGGIHKSVKKLMCDKKLPVAARDTVPLLCLNGEILWIPSVISADGITAKSLDSK